MRKGTIFALSFVWILIVFSLTTTPALAGYGIFFGKVVATEFFVIQVKGGNGKVSAFWIGFHTHFDSRIPFFGDKVRIEYVKGKWGRNVVTRITILG